jgi:iron-sulfur cluster insertion protein
VRRGEPGAYPSRHAKIDAPARTGHHARLAREEPHNTTEETKMDMEIDTQNFLVFTDSAVGKVRELIEEEGNSALKLRVFVSGGGCSGFQYGFTFDEEANEDDVSFEKGGVTLLVDSMSYQYLVGAEIDYTEGLEGSQFVIRNPNATSTCGCGSSFSV